MSIETKRIYKIDKDDFYGITQGTRPIVDDKGNITGHVQNPVATIRYEDRLLVVEPYQVEFIEDSETETGIAWHIGEGYSEDIDSRIDMFSDHLNEDVPTRESLIVESISDFARQVIDAKIGSEYEEIGKGYKQLRIVWRV